MGEKSASPGELPIWPESMPPAVDPDHPQALKKQVGTIMAAKRAISGGAAVGGEDGSGSFLSGASVQPDVAGGG